MNSFIMSVVIVSHETMLVKCTKTTLFTEKGQKIYRVCLIMQFIPFEQVFLLVNLSNEQKLYHPLRQVVRFTGFVSKCTFHCIWAVVLLRFHDTTIFVPNDWKSNGIWGSSIEISWCDHYCPKWLKIYWNMRL